ncbi:MAG: hypothetical protein ACMUIM_01635 [bacterium]
MPAVGYAGERDPQQYRVLSGAVIMLNDAAVPQGRLNRNPDYPYEDNPIFPENPPAIHFDEGEPTNKLALDLPDLVHEWFYHMPLLVQDRTVVIYQSKKFVSGM